MGSIPPHALFLRRDDRHDSGRILLRGSFFQLHVVRVVVLRVCPVLSGPGDLSIFCFASENQVGRVGLSGVFNSRICWWLEFLPHGANRGVGQLSDLFWAGNYLRGAAPQRSFFAPEALCAEFSKRNRAASQMRSLRSDRVDRSESRFPRLARWRRILHRAFAEGGNTGPLIAIRSCRGACAKRLGSSVFDTNDATPCLTRNFHGGE